MVMALDPVLTSPKEDEVNTSTARSTGRVRRTFDSGAGGRRFESDAAQTLFRVPKKCEAEITS